jgi:hypothetical protein
VADVLLVLLTVAVFALVMGLLAWATRRHRGRRLGSSVAGPFEEIWHPAAHRARIDVEVQDERKIDMPSAGDPPGHDLGLVDRIEPGPARPIHHAEPSAETSCVAHRANSSPPAR